SPPVLFFKLSFIVSSAMPIVSSLITLHSSLFPCSDTFNKIPTLISATTSDDPPALTNGNGIPFVGVRASVTLILKKVWVINPVDNPTANDRPNFVCAPGLARQPRKRKNQKIRTRDKAQYTPNPSPITAKRKSELASGRNPSFWRLGPKPKPLAPPE